MLCNSRPSGLRRAIAAAALFVAAAQAVGYAQYFPDDRISCRTCHESEQRKTDFCELFQAAIFEHDDKHGKAFFLLHESDPADPQKGTAKRELVRRILGFDLREAFTDDRFTRLNEGRDEDIRRKVAAVKACLRCHATWPKDADPEFPDLPPVALELGVSCQACHGPGLKWNLPHYLTAWRCVTPAGKASLGFADVRTPAAKAKLCASCHVGNLAEEKFVKHEWYAGGHPPLPNFEYSSFAAQMPMHWKPLPEKKPFMFREGTLDRRDSVNAANVRTLRAAGVPEEAIKANYLEANFPDASAKNLDPLNDLWRSKDVIATGSAIFEVYTRLVGDYAALANQGQAPWPELALYDCTACHHELRSGPASATRPRRLQTPGRPPLPLWPRPLAQVAARHVAEGDTSIAAQRWLVVQAKVKDLDQATTVRPFGDSAAMVSTSRALAEALGQLSDNATTTRFDQAAARRAIQFLADPSQVETNDFTTARQTAWAIRQIALDLQIAGAENLFDRDQHDVLALRLPSGLRASVMENLPRWLGAAARFDPDWFRGELKTVREHSGSR